MDVPQCRQCQYPDASMVSILLIGLSAKRRLNVLAHLIKQVNIHLMVQKTVYLQECCLP